MLHQFLMNLGLKIILISILFFSIGCKTQFNSSVIIEERNIVLTEKENKFDVKNNDLNIIYETGFNNELVGITLDSDVIISESISTDDITGSSLYVPIKNYPKQYLLFSVNNKLLIKLSISKIKGYKYIYINKNSNEYNFTISNRPRLYY